MGTREDGTAGEDSTTGTPSIASGAGSAASGTVVVSLPRPHVAIISLGAPEERVVTLTPARIESLVSALADLEKRRLRGIIITGSHSAMFSVGADVNLIQKVHNPLEGSRLAEMGQSAFERLARLDTHTVAALSGPCVGGGFELALACKTRIISDDPSSMVGLPEVKLGIIPGFGGTQRLPRLIGITRALEVILSGKTYRPQEALKLGLVDKVVSVDALLEAAISVAELPREPRPRLPLRERLLTSFGLGRRYVSHKARLKTSRKGGSHYPALPAAIEAVQFGLDHGMTEGLKHEAERLGELIVNPTSKALVHLFLATESSKGLGKSGKVDLSQGHSLVVGAGTMGAGIAAELARAGSVVILRDVKPEAVQAGLNRVKAIFDNHRGLSPEEKSAAFQRIEGTTGLPESLGNVNLVVEAVFEDLSIKEQVLGELVSRVPDDALITSNTSALPISALAERLPHPERFVGLHFFNPVDRMPLVEIVRGRLTSAKTIVLAAALVAKLKKFPIVVEDVPGFLVNRILTPYMNEALWLLQEGYAIDEIDQAAVKFGMPMGPIRLADEVGLDIAYEVSRTLREGYGERFAVPDLVRTLLSEGRKGKKTKLGFYSFETESARVAADIDTLLKIPRAKQSLSPEQLAERLLLPMINEMVRSYDEGVAGLPSKEAAQQIDLGSVMGFGFPAFRGGIFYYAANLGPKEIVRQLNGAAASAGSRLSPTPGLVTRVEKNLSLYDAP